MHTEVKTIFLVFLALNAGLSRRWAWPRLALVATTVREAWSASVLVLVVSFCGAGAAEFHVASAGNDSNPGTFAQPYATISKASGILTAGDTCVIHAGTYREILRPVNSGAVGNLITYRAAGDGVVIVSGADMVSGWANYQGDIFRASTAIDRGARKNQIFVDGRMMVEARWPNVPWDAAGGFDMFDAMNLAKASIGTGSTTMTVQGLNQPDGFWNGATVWALIGGRWTAQTATVTASTAGSITISGKSTPWFPDAFASQGQDGGAYLTGKLEALDAPGEWFLQSGTVYLMTVDRSDPSRHVVEVRNGRLTVDLSARNGIVLTGITCFAGAANITGNNCTLQNCTFRYISHEPTKPSYGYHGGITISGSGNLIDRCRCSDSSGNGIFISGSSNTVRNSIVRNVNYAVDYSTGVYLSGLGSLNVIEHCRLERAGRSLMALYGTDQNVRYNDLSQAVMLSQDSGAMYAWNTNGRGNVIAYNGVHDSRVWALTPKTAPHDGIYLDDGCLNFTVHHNVVWNCDDGVRMGHVRPTSGHRVYNNTLWANRDKSMAQHGSGTFTDIVVWNNLSDHADFLGTDIQNNLSTTDGKFVAMDLNDYRLTSASPAVDVGKTIVGITDGFQGTAPDVGAYEFGGAAWTFGASGAIGAPLPGDLNGDGAVNQADITVVMINFGRRNGEPGWDATVDLDGDGSITAKDLSLVLRSQTF